MRQTLNPSLPMWEGSGIHIPGCRASKPPPTPSCQYHSGQGLLPSRAGDGRGVLGFVKKSESMRARETASGDRQNGFGS